MKFRNASVFFVFVFVWFLPAITAKAQGVVLPVICEARPCRPAPRPQPLPNVLPVKSISINTKIENQVATTRVEQIFRNDTRHTLEGTYFFPIPETASVTEFAIWENGKKLVGEVRSREEARRIYDEIVRRQRDPGLLEYAGKDLFQASIFPIQPDSDKKLELTYTQVLKAESATVAYRYPLGTGKNLWRNQRPDNFGGDAERPSNAKGAQKFGIVSGKIEIVGREALRNIYSPSHSIETSRKGEKAALVSFETSGNDNDFQLFYGVSNNDFGVSLLTYREAGKDGYFLLLLSPKENISESELVNKDIVFVLDTSGSMADEGKMEKARAALLFGIRTLRDGDRFNVVNFAGEEHLMESQMIRADAEGKRRGENFVKNLTPTGGTNINDSLIASLKQFGGAERPQMLVFMTDGLPTVGEQRNEKIIENVKRAKTANVRIFPFGFGYDVNTQLLDRLGAENAGVSDYVEPKEDLEIKVSNFFTKVSSPVLSDLAIDFGAVEIDYMYPRKLTDLFKGMQVAIIGRYKNERDLRGATVRLTGKTGKTVKNFSYANLDFPLRSEANDFLPRLWASRRVGWLIEQIRLNGETKELRDELVQLGTRYGIVTPYTSYLATDGSLVQSETAVISRPSAKSVSDSMRNRSGAGAVKMSKQQNTLQSNATLAQDKNKADAEQILLENTATNQFVGSKNFVNQNGVWVDAEFDEKARLPETKLQFADADYFELIKREKTLAQYFALGEQVVVVWNNRVYRVVK